MSDTQKWRLDKPHARTVTDVVGQLDVEPEAGLSSDEAGRRLQDVGPNALEEDSGPPWWRILWDQLASAVVVLLIGAAVVGLAIGEVVEAAAIGVVLVANTVVGFLTELQAARSMAALQEMVRTVAEVERDDRRDEVDARDLVPGDVVAVEPGETVPADVRLLEAEDLTVEESSLTGESAPVRKTVDAVDERTPLAERTNMLFMGTTVQSGRGRGVVVGTGASTEMGRVAELAESADDTQAPLQQGLARLSGRLAIVVVLGAAVLSGIGLFRGQEVREILEVAIALAIAVVPEGLPAVATLTLAVGMRRMAHRQALVRRLPAVETLGSTTVVCSDKTGTLTTNEMQVVEVVSAEDIDEPALWETAALCNDADVDPDGDPVGDPTEVALLHGAAAAGLDWRELRKSRERKREVPFDAETKRMATVYGDVVHIKGAPEVLLVGGEPRALKEASERMADEALRTLAFARRDAPAADAADDDLFANADLLGVVGMQDPPRRTAVETVATFKEAGIRTVMITGDRPRTAGALARQIGLHSERVVTGAELEERSDEEVIALLRDREVDVFARVEPEHKLRIVDALQRLGEVIAVTGDGVNDAPALSQANVGVAMGTGTDVAQEAADIVLADDDFSTIGAAIEEGRRIFANIRRFGQFLFSWHVAEVAAVATAVVIGIEPPLVGLMILWNNLVIDVLPSFALALEPGRAEVMKDPPRDPSESVINRSVVQRILTQGLLVAAVGLTAYAIGLTRLDLDTEAAQTLAFVTLSGAQLLSVFNARTDRGSGFRGATENHWLWAALGLTLALEAAALFIGPLADVLGLVDIPAAAWVVAAVFIPLPLLIVQGSRIVRDRGGGGRIRADALLPGHASTEGR